MTRGEAGRIVAARHTQTCEKCNPDTCQEDVTGRAYFRYDDLAPQHTYARSHSLDLPNMFRLPYLTEETNMTDYFADERMRIPSRTYLFEYNPTLAHLPSNQIPANLDQTKSYYLGIFRLASINECLTKDQRMKLLDPLRMSSPGTEMMGFVIMDANLNILQQSIKYHANFIDHRVFNLRGELYLGYMHQINRLRIGSTNAAGPNVIPAQNVSDPAVFRRLFDGPSPLFRQDFEVYMEEQSACCRSDLCRGKNFNYFIDQQGAIMVETKPFGAHIVETMNVRELCPSADLRHNLLTYAEEAQLSARLQEGHNNVKNGTSSVYISSLTPPESYHTQDKLYFPQMGVYQPPGTPDRGTACCVRIPDPRFQEKDVHHNNNQPYLLVGVSHSKYPAWKQLMELQQSTPGFDFPLRGYMSRLYAFEPFPPYHVVARSGKFCLPAPPNVTATTGSESMENPNVMYLQQSMFHIAGTTLSCPLIHFVSTIVDAIDDPTRYVIVGYGLNDCTSRMIRVPKSELLRLLFPPKSG